MAGYDEKRAWHDELQRFKREINLVAFAERFGYQVDERSGSYTRLRRGPGDQIVVTRARDGSYLYVNPENCAPRAPGAAKPPGVDQGTIVDFLQREQHSLSLPALRRELRAHLGEHPDAPTSALQPRPEFDRAAITRQLDNAPISCRSDYLATRGLRPETLRSDRIFGTVRVRASGEVLFPHHDQLGATGFERKHPRFTLFATGGRRALWHSRLRSTDTALVIAESGIDCLSYYQLHPLPHVRYMSTGGTLSAVQQDLVARAITKLPAGGRLVVASDNDRAGRQIAERITSIATSVRSDLSVDLPVPPRNRKDWNDVVQDREVDFIRHAKRTHLSL